MHWTEIKLATEEVQDNGAKLKDQGVKLWSGSHTESLPDESKPADMLSGRIAEWSALKGKEKHH